MNKYMMTLNMTYPLRIPFYLISCLKLLLFELNMYMYLLYYTMIYKITTSGNFTNVFVLQWTISWYNPCVLSWLVDQYRILIMWYVSTRRLMWSNSIKQNWNMRTKWICCTRLLVHFQYHWILEVIFRERHSTSLYSLKFIYIIMVLTLICCFSVLSSTSYELFVKANIDTL